MHRNHLIDVPASVLQFLLEVCHGSPSLFIKRGHIFALSAMPEHIPQIPVVFGDMLPVIIITATQVAVDGLRFPGDVGRIVRHSGRDEAQYPVHHPSPVHGRRTVPQGLIRHRLYMMSRQSVPGGDVDFGHDLHEPDRFAESASSSFVEFDEPAVERMDFDSPPVPSVLRWEVGLPVFPDDWDDLIFASVLPEGNSLGAEFEISDTAQRSQLFQDEILCHPGGIFEQGMVAGDSTEVDIAEILVIGVLLQRTGQFHLE